MSKLGKSANIVIEWKGVKEKKAFKLDGWIIEWMDRWMDEWLGGWVDWYLDTQI